MPIARHGEAFYGREAELRSLADSLLAAERGEAQIVVVEADAGMGKTALVRHFVRLHTDLIVLDASGDEAEAVVDQGVIDQLARSVPKEHIADLPLLSSLPAALADPFSVGAELVQVLGILQERATVALVVDDLHWADPASARALLFTLRRLRSDHVLVLLTTRPEGFARLGEGWQRLRADTSRGRRIALGGLSASEVRGLAARFSGIHLSASGAERLRAHTDGHPLYVRSLLEELPDTALTASSGPLPAPHSLSETVVARLAGLSASAQDLVAAAAAVGERSSLPTVAAVAGIPDVTAALEEAMAAGLLEEVRGGSIDELTFPHPLTRAAVYDDLAPTRRRTLHAAAARLIPGAHSLSQRVAAADGPDDDLAADLESAAGTEILAGATSAAADHLLWASELSSDGASRQARLLTAVNAVLLTDDETRARSMKPAVEACSDGAGRSYTLGWLTYLAGDPAEAQAHFHRSVESASQPSSPEAGMAAGSLAAMSATRGDASAAISWAEQALGAPEGYPGVHAYSRMALAVGRSLRGEGLEAVSSLGPIDSTRPTPAPFEAELLASRGQIRLWSNDLFGAVEDLVTVVRWSRQGAPVRLIANVYTNLADAHYRMGTWADAAVYAELSVSLAEDMEAVWELFPAHAVASYVYSGRGEWQPASEHITACQRAAERVATPGAQHYSALAQATLARARGDHQAVLAALAPGLRGPLRQFTEDRGSIHWRVLLAEALTGVGRLKEAEEQVGAIEGIAGRHDAIPLRVEAWRLRGSLEDARGEAKVAEAAFAEGMAALDGTSLPFPQALLEAAHGRFLRRADRRRAAIEGLRAARQRLAALEARPYLVFCDAELASCGLRPPPGAPANPFGLTAKERAVAHLAAEGMSNREIAAELYVSAKAIEYHLGNVFTKLGVTSRRQLRPAIAPAAAG